MNYEVQLFFKLCSALITRANIGKQNLHSESISIFSDNIEIDDKDDFNIIKQ